MYGWRDFSPEVVKGLHDGDPRFIDNLPEQARRPREETRLFQS